MKKLLISLTVLITIGLSLSSCLKDKTQDPGFNVQEVGTNATALIEIPLDVYLQADRAIRFQRDSIIYKNINQATFSFNMGYINLTVYPADTVTYPKTIVLDFGSDATKPYQGKMTLTLSGNMRNAGSKCAISYLNLISSGNTLTGNDSIISLGINASGSIVSHFNMHGGELKGYNSEKVTYSGNVFAKYNLASKANVLDSVELNATDANLNVYKAYSVATYKLQLTTGCNYFNTGVISTDIRVKNVLAGNLVYDYSYSSLMDGTVNACDADGLIYIYSKINSNYQQQYGFYAMQFL